MKYRIKRIGKCFHAQVFITGFPLGVWRDIDCDGKTREIPGCLLWTVDSEAAARKNIDKHKVIEAENNDIEIIEVAS